MRFSSVTVFDSSFERFYSPYNKYGKIHVRRLNYPVCKLRFGSKFMSIYVGNLSYDVTEEDLQAVFADYGEVKRVHLPVDRETKRMRGFGFVEMSNDNEEEKAIETLDGAQWMGRQMKVNKANPREEGGNDRRRNFRD